MKIIDKKGRLFGLINIIDLAVLLVVLAIAVFGASRMGRRAVTSVGTKQGIVKYEISDVRQVTVDQIMVGDPIYHYDKGTYIGEIVDKKVEPFVEKVDYNGKWVDAVVPRKFIVTIDVQANLEETEQFYLAGGEQTRVGIQYRMKNKNFASFGTCLGVTVEE